jgi:hypothetical protein
VFDYDVAALCDAVEYLGQLRHQVEIIVVRLGDRGRLESQRTPIDGEMPQRRTIRTHANAGNAAAMS